MRQAVAAAVLATAAGCALAQAPATAASPAAAEPPAQPAPSAEAGRQAYTSFCVRCHGINLVVTGSAFYDLRTFPKGDKARFMESVSKGKRAMPAWAGIVRPDQMESIWLYMGQVNGW
jgi:cytochrome c55X